MHEDIGVFWVRFQIDLVGSLRSLSILQMFIMEKKMVLKAYCMPNHMTVLSILIFVAVRLVEKHGVT